MHFPGGISVHRLHVRSSRDSDVGGVRVSGAVNTIGGKCAADPIDAQRSPPAVQDGHEVGAQGTWPRETVGRPSDTNHRKSARTARRRHHRTVARQRGQRHHMGDYVLVGNW